MGEFFIKKLGRQEMGSPKVDEHGKLKFQRGRYMLISKEFCDFFPRLSTTVLNDCTALPIITEHSDEIIYAQYVYHNSKHVDTSFVVGQPRDETRIYLNSELDSNKRLFRPGEIVVFMRCREGDVQFYVVHIFPKDSLDYSFWDDKLGNSTYARLEIDEAPTFEKHYELPRKSATIIGDHQLETAVKQQQQRRSCGALTTIGLRRAWAQACSTAARFTILS